jgi:hypothetical protein
MNSKRLLAVFLAALFLVLSAQRSPAPITETADTPTPAPAATFAPVKSTLEKATQVKSARERTPARSSSRPAPSASPSLAMPKRFAGTWVGILSWSFFGDTEFDLVVDPSETTVTRLSKKFPNERPVARAEINGNTLIARFSMMAGTFELTLNGDGRTAIVHGSAPTADSTAVFRKE